jgi:hypothetical protein
LICDYNYFLSLFIWNPAYARDRECLWRMPLEIAFENAFDNGIENEIGLEMK